MVVVEISCNLGFLFSSLVLFFSAFLIAQSWLGAGLTRPIGCRHYCKHSLIVEYQRTFVGSWGEDLQIP